MKNIIAAKTYTNFVHVIQQETGKTIGWEQVAWYTFLAQSALQITGVGRDVGRRVRSLAMKYFSSKIRPWVESRPYGWESIHEDTDIESELDWGGLKDTYIAYQNSNTTPWREEGQNSRAIGKDKARSRQLSCLTSSSWLRRAVTVVFGILMTFPKYTKWKSQSTKIISTNSWTIWTSIYKYKILKNITLKQRHISFSMTLRLVPCYRGPLFKWKFGKVMHSEN